ncbi:hypothetical protein L7F22_019493 [Adiantum nelumboides]|nr:hypothetical protein [Adiantum nelumboides]
MSGQSTRVVHWPTGNASWNTALTQFAKTVNPKSQLPKGVYLRSDTHTLAIYDGYPKAKFHFLILPRIPFNLDQSNNSGTAVSQSTSSSSASKPALGLAGGKLNLGASSKGLTVPAAHLHSLSSLLASPYASEVLEKMRKQSESVVELIKEEMRHYPLPDASDDGTCQVEWPIRVGFHAVPSMDTIHLHVISDDLVSDRLKHKKHYQSFHPTHGFWLELDTIQELVRQGKKSLPNSEAHYESLLKSPLISFRDGKVYPNMPKLKDHLEQAWIENLKQRREKVNPTRKLAGTKHDLEQDNE